MLRHGLRIQSFFDEDGSNPTVAQDKHNLAIVTVTVVAYPNGVFSTLGQTENLPAPAVTDSKDEHSSTVTLLTTDPTSNPSTNAASIWSATSPIESITSSGFSAPAIPLSSRVESIIQETSSGSEITDYSTRISSPTRPSAPATSGLGLPTSATQSNLSTQRAPLYIGIALGSVAGIAILSAFLSWIIRLRRTKRRQTPQLPWSKGDDDLDAFKADWGAGYETTLLGPHTSTNHLRSTELWGMEGDRDVGEPKHSSEYQHVPEYVDGHGHPNSSLSSDGVGMHRKEHQPNTDRYAHVRVPTIRHLPSHLINENLTAGTLGLDRLRGAEVSLGTPRTEVDIPRYLNLNAKGDDGLAVPWRSNVPSSSPRSMAERLRRLDRPADQNNATTSVVSSKAQNLDLDGEEHHEGWTGSLTSNLVNAFNAVAANIPAFGASDAITTKTASSSGPLPSRRQQYAQHQPQFRRNSVVSPIGAVFEPTRTRLDGILPGADTAELTGSNPSKSETSDLSWTLEETSDGAGVVKLHRSSIVEMPGEKRERAGSGLGLNPPPRSDSLDRPSPAMLRTNISNQYLENGRGNLSRSTQGPSSSRNPDPNSCLGAATRKDRASIPSRTTSMASTYSSWSSSATHTQVLEALRSRRTYSGRIDTPPRER
ncbi:hypothetical protein FA15DRAFT_674900 [Coprinopsis marcescibilis]|uniref:Uncharacterized protein n=1 Tax=Coprinopsis marcescibilis TaxID=230819 RepID=A0A5C3KG17_COPMA|nr:hypothetical protein FA15DRAFT_674900 [Coprinopsis marcescibilis]